MTTVKLICVLVRIVATSSDYFRMKLFGTRAALFYGIRATIIRPMPKAIHTRSCIMTPILFYFRTHHCFLFSNELYYALAKRSTCTRLLMPNVTTVFPGCVPQIMSALSNKVEVTKIWLSTMRIILF